MKLHKSSHDKFEFGEDYWKVRVNVVNDRYIMNIDQIARFSSSSPTWAFMEYHRGDRRLWYEAHEGLWPVPITDEIRVHLSPTKSVTILQLVDIIERQIYRAYSERKA